MSKRYEGRMEVCTVRDEIARRLELGETVHSVYLDLAEQNKITISKATFYRQVQKQVTHTTPPIRRRSPPPHRQNTTVPGTANKTTDVPRKFTLNTHKSMDELV